MLLSIKNEAARFQSRIYVNKKDMWRLFILTLRQAKFRNNKLKNKRK